MNPPDRPKRRVRGQGIVKASDLFEKYKKILRAPEQSVIQCFIGAVYEKLHITLNSEQCSYAPRTRTLTLRASGMVKSEIQFSKEVILDAMKKELGERNAPRVIL